VGPAKDSREAIEQDLLAKLQTAQREFHGARDRVERLSVNGTNPDERRKAAAKRSAAESAYLEALKAFSNFVLGNVRR
jgi:hypothetical protein